MKIPLNFIGSLKIDLNQIFNKIQNNSIVLLYLQSIFVGELSDRMFIGARIQNMQLCGILFTAHVSKCYRLWQGT